MQYLQSSLNRTEGLGTTSLSVVYGSLIVSCVFLPSLLIGTIGCKRTIAVCFVPYVLYMIANLYARWGTLIPASVLMGLAAAPLWAAKCTYLTELGKRYAAVSVLTEEAAINRFFGIFFMAFQSGMKSSGSLVVIGLSLEADSNGAMFSFRMMRICFSALVWGSLMSSFILQKAPENGTWFSDVPDSQLAKCGVLYCSDTDVEGNTNLDRPEDFKAKNIRNQISHQPLKCPHSCSLLDNFFEKQVYTLCGIFIACGILAILTVVLLVDKNPGVSRQSPLHELSSTTSRGTRAGLRAICCRFSFFCQDYSSSLNGVLSFTVIANRAWGSSLDSLNKYDSAENLPRRREGQLCCKRCVLCPKPTSRLHQGCTVCTKQQMLCHVLLFNSDALLGATFWWKR